MIVDHYTNKDSHLQQDGRRRVEHVFVDHAGMKYLDGARLVSGLWGESEYAAQRESMVATKNQKLLSNEFSFYLQELKNNRNPFRDPENNLVPPKYHSFQSAVKAVSDFLRELSGDELVEFRFVFNHLLNLGTDDELIAILELTSEELIEIRLREDVFKRLNSALAPMGAMNG